MNNILTFAVSGKKGHGKDTLGLLLLDQAQQLGYNTVHKNLADPLKEEATLAIALWEMCPIGNCYVHLLDKVKEDAEQNQDKWEGILLWFTSVFGISPDEAFKALSVIVARALGQYDDPSGDDTLEIIQTSDEFKERYLDILYEFNHPTLKAGWRVLLQWWGTEFRRRMCGDNYWTDKVVQFQKTLPTNTIHLIADMRFPDEYELCAQQLNAFTVRIYRPDVESDEVTASHASETGLDHIPQSQWNAYVSNHGSLDDLKNTAHLLLTNALMWAKWV